MNTNTILPLSAARVRRTSGIQRLGKWLLALLLILPITAAAAGNVWCTWFGLFCAATPTSQVQEVTQFGSNPGNLRMFEYVPQNLEASRPVVVALHGCLQQAADYDDEPGWIQFADKYRFALLLPQQQVANNPMKCFNWFLPEDTQRDQGEALSIRQMIQKMQSDLKSDPRRAYVTGLSGGGAMTAVMLATYPDVFAGGAIIAGVPYKCANNADEATRQCGVSVVPGKNIPMKDFTPQQWGDLVRNASRFNVPFPRVSIWQGSKDDTVNPVDAREILEQWTNVAGIDQTPEINEMVKEKIRHQVFQDASGNALVETYLIDGMTHGTPIDPGAAANQCGKPAPFILPAGICSSFYIAKFWGLDKLSSANPNP